MSLLRYLKRPRTAQCLDQEEGFSSRMSPGPSRYVI